MVRICFVLLSALLLVACVPRRARDAEKESAIEVLMAGGIDDLRKSALPEAQAKFLLAYEMGAGAPALDGLGCTAFRAGRYDEAEKYMRQAIDADSGYATAKVNLATLFAHRGQPHLAESLYRAALRQHPQHYRGRNNFAVLLAERGEGRAALLQLRQALPFSASGPVSTNIDKIGNGYECCEKAKKIALPSGRNVR